MKRGEIKRMMDAAITVLHFVGTTKRQIVKQSSLYYSVFCCYSVTTEARYFIKARDLFSSQFWRLKVQDQAAQSSSPLVRAPLAV
jgi:hypothetical protein